MKTIGACLVALSAFSVAAQPKLQNLKTGDNGREITVKRGETFTVTLDSNPSTGYQQHMIVRGDEPWVLVKKLYLPLPNSERKVGAGGTERFEFRATKSGSNKLTFVNIRSFDLKTIGQATPWQVQVTVK